MTFPKIAIKWACAKSFILKIYKKVMKLSIISCAIVNRFNKD